MTQHFPSARHPARPQEHEHEPGHEQGQEQEHGQEHGHGHTPAQEENLAHLLELDAETSGGALAEVLAWVAQCVTSDPHTVVDLGTGTGAGALALARRFPGANVVAVDRSTVMLDRVRTAAHDQGLHGRVRTVAADVDLSWPVIDVADLVWASSFLHEVTDPGAALGEIRAALRPGGLLAVVEMDALPRFLPDDDGTGRPGLEPRCHDALADAGWNAHPDWQPLLEQAGFEVLGRRTVDVRAQSVPSAVGRHAHAWISHMRAALQDRLAPEDLAALDRLLDPGSPEALLHRSDLSVRSSRTVWAARRP